ncbi:MAG: RNA 3'-terminal phosphate cyclase [Methanosarcinaceae archaeon]|nr:RNA 3'-terminal phosphate cyclase [Methanosarcinaceae archaeon]
MITIDGSYGEGGGQIVRSAVALSAVTGEEVCIENIRRGRRGSGLHPQHVKAIQATALLCDAEVTGLSIGSTAITFSPLEIKGGSCHINIGTAGSIALLLQCIMPASAFAKKGTELTITGGTDVLWAPSVDYLKNVTIRALEMLGYDCAIQIIKRGYYPKGQGHVVAKITPSHLRPFNLTPYNCKMQGISHCSGLPEHVAQRQADAAGELLREAGYPCNIAIAHSDDFSTGSGITLSCGLKGSCMPGKRGLPAEKLGRTAAHHLIEELSSNTAVDIHLADQLIPYMGFAKGSSFTTRKITEHTRTNIWVTEQFLDVKFNIEKEKGMVRISVP